ncbi:MAG: DNA-3-methyladenine glycosylase [Cytophagales bacterium]|nr:DNA-3-methyladenine glycosylase [Cytophagales bacterium]
MNPIKLPRNFYLNPDVVSVAKDLIGKVLVTNVNGTTTSGVIIETEAYAGRDDKACHANNGKRTPRNEVMYHPGGLAYVYLCYGIHHLFNVVTNVENMADAVLIRGILPFEGKETMKNRRNMSKPFQGALKGPGILTQALGIQTSLNGTDLLGNSIWIEDRGHRYPEDKIASGPRIGVGYAGEDAKKPWRFYVKEFYLNK